MSKTVSPRQMEHESRFDSYISAKEIGISVLDSPNSSGEIDISVREIGVSSGETGISPEELGYSPKESSSATRATSGPTPSFPHSLLCLPKSHLLLCREKAMLWCA